MGLSVRQLAERDGKITASFLPKLMAGEANAILQEWRRLVGDPAYEPEDMSAIWAVQFGHWLEPHALDWHAKKTGQEIVRRGEVVNHTGKIPVCCTLDGFREHDRCVIDVKTMNAHAKIDARCAYYTSQMVVQKACVGADRAALLVVHGGTEPVEYPLEWDAAYEAQVWDRVAEFWQCVIDLTRPVEMPVIAAPIQAVKEYDMTGNNQWGSEAAAWLEHRDSAKRFTNAEKELKALIPGDAKRARGHGITVTRSKAGALTIRESKDAD